VPSLVPSLKSPSFFLPVWPMPPLILYLQESDKGGTFVRCIILVVKNNNEKIITMGVLESFAVERTDTWDNILKDKVAGGYFFMKNISECLCLGLCIESGLNTRWAIGTDLLDQICLIYHELCKLTLATTK